jgi:hypothetical protein
MIRGQHVSDDELPRQADVQQVSWQLNQSLKSCRAMVANYRLMLGGGANDNQPADHGNERFVDEESEAEA